MRLIDFDEAITGWCVDDFAWAVVTFADRPPGEGGAPRALERPRRHLQIFPRAYQAERPLLPSEVDALATPSRSSTLRALDRLALTGDEAVGASIERHGLEAPLRQLVENSGGNGTALLAKLRRLRHRSGTAADAQAQIAIARREQGDIARARSHLEPALEISSAMGSPAAALFLHNLGVVAEDERDDAPARSYIEESVLATREIGNAHNLAVVLEWFVSLAALQDQPERALGLIGVAAALRERIGMPVSPSWRPRVVCTLERARTRVGR